MSERCDIAIIGMSSLFAKAPNKEQFWNNILGKVDAVGQAPDGWLGAAHLLDPNADMKKVRLYTERGGFLGDLSRFDPKPFGTMPISVAGAEPDQFLALAAAKDAIEDAGYGDGKRLFDPSRAGVILGHGIHANRGNVNGIQQVLVIDQMISLLRSLFPEAERSRIEEIEHIMHSKLPPLSVDTVPGLVPNMMTGRICNRLNLMGPNYIIDAACASSLIAVEAAARELRSGRADLMLAGGVNTTSSTLVFAVFCQIGALSRKGAIRPFAAECDGTLLGEGCGIFALKRLEDAQSDDDRIYAVIKGIGLASDGRSSGLMAPRLEGEILAIQRAYEQAQLDPASIDLIEAHGTGIPLGDQTEIAALRTVFGERQKTYPHVAIGSVKSMIGHCIPAAGAASMVKMSMALHEGILPPTLCGEVSHDIALEKTSFYVNTDQRPWIRGRGPRRAGINAFGFGGINSHMILEEAPGRGGAQAAFGLRRLPTPELCGFAAVDLPALMQAIHNAQEKALTADSLCALAAELNSHLGNGSLRLAIIADSLPDLRMKLSEAAKKLAGNQAKPFQTRSGIYYRPAAIQGRVAFVFPGENSQYPNMQRSVALASPLFRSWLDRLDGLFGEERKMPHRDLLFPPHIGLSEEERQRLVAELGRVDAGSESVFFSDFGYLKLLNALGVQADVMVGHSTGENAALLASGMLDLGDEDICRYIKDMNHIFSDLEAEGVIPTGVLITVGAAHKRDIEDVVAKVDGVLFTMDNCPNQAVLFCSEARAQDVETLLAEKNAICMRLPLSWAYHTQHIQPMADRFKELFANVPLRTSEKTLYSCVTTKPYPKERNALLETAAAQYMSRVRFTEVIRNMYADGARIFVEVGPGNTLTGFVRDILKDEEYLALACDNPRREGVFSFLSLLGQLFTAHVFNDLEKLGAPAAELPVRARPTHLPSELPLIYLNEREIARTRHLLIESSDSPQMHITPAREQTAEGKPNSGDCKTVPMNQPVEARAFHQPSQNNSVVWYDWTAQFGAPDVIVRAVSLRRIVRDARELEPLAELFLAGDEMEMWRGKLAKSLLRRRQEWLLGRIAAKSAVAAACGETLDFSAISIPYEENGKPFASRSDGGTAPLISISHKNGFAVAAAATRPVGIDIELLNSVREASLLAERILGVGEIQMLNGRAHSEGLIATLWAIKEASAKTISAPFLGHEREIEIKTLDFANNRAVVQIGGAEIESSFRWAQRYVCALARAN